jgi:hypothetical protein
VVTTNLASKEGSPLLHNAAATTAIADRLIHGGLLVRAAGKSVRPPKDLAPGATAAQPLADDGHHERDSRSLRSRAHPFHHPATGAQSVRSSGSASSRIVPTQFRRVG